MMSATDIDRYTTDTGPWGGAGGPGRGGSAGGYGGGWSVGGFLGGLLGGAFGLNAMKGSDNDSHGNGQVGGNSNQGQPSAASGGVPGGPEDDDRDRKDPAKHEAYKDELRANMQKPAVRDPELRRMMDAMYRPGAKVGSGSTASAVRQEMQTGVSVQGRFHTQKAGEMAGRLEGWLSRNPTASSGDRAAAENTLRDLQNALSGKP